MSCRADILVTFRKLQAPHINPEKGKQGPCAYTDPKTSSESPTFLFPCQVLGLYYVLQR